jgi:NADH-quinone oxidoreductase subunit L
MFRLYFLTFKNKFRGTHEQEHHLHESPKSMTIPLVILAILSVVGGVVGIPEVFGGTHFLEEFLKPVFSNSASRIIFHLPETTEFMLMGIATAVMIAAIYYAYTVYVKNNTVPSKEEEVLDLLHNLVYHKYWIDEIYETFITKPLNLIAEALHKLVDNQIIDGIVNGVGSTVNWLSGTIRLAQTGNTGFYIFVMVISIVLILFTQLF